MLEELHDSIVWESKRETMLESENKRRTTSYRCVSEIEGLLIICILHAFSPSFDTERNAFSLSKIEMRKA